MGWRGAATIAIAAVCLAASLAGCGVRFILGAEIDVNCTAIHMGTCREQAERAAGDHLDAIEVSVVCTAAVCDRAHGAGTTEVPRSDGTTIHDTFRYDFGDAAPLPAPVCTGLDAPTCQIVVDNYEMEMRPEDVVKEFEVTCSIASCDPDRADVLVRVTKGDGSVLSYQSGWTTGVP